MPAGQHIAHFYICTRSARSSFSASPALPRLGHRDKLLELILGGGLTLGQTQANTRDRHTRQDATHTHMDSPLCPAWPPRALMTSWLNQMLKCPSFSCLYLAGGGAGWATLVWLSLRVIITWLVVSLSLLGSLCVRARRLPHTGPGLVSPVHLSPAEPGSRPAPRPERADRAQPARTLTHPVQLCTHHIMSLKTFCKHQ